MSGLTERIVPFWQFKSLIWGMSSGFPLANHLALPDSESELGVSQDPLMCVHTPLKPSGFYQKGIWVETASLDIVPLSACKESFLCVCGKGRSLDFFRNERYVVWAGPSLLP